MNLIATSLPGVVILEPKVFADERGFFMETFNSRQLDGLGLTRNWVQDNQSHSQNNVLRGLHYQLGRPQAKLVRAVQGEIFDVAVDVRRNSPTFGHWTGVLLSSSNHRMLFVPEGFAHGFYVTSETAEVIYKCSDFYAPQEERGLIWNDPQVGIDWPIPLGVTPSLSPKDKVYRTLREISAADLPRNRGVAA